jgi:putative endopeptidase
LVFALTTISFYTNVRNTPNCDSLYVDYPRELRDLLFEPSIALESKKKYHYLRTALIRAINSTAWIDENTKKKAIKKALRMAELVGIPNVHYSYENLKICSTEDFFRNKIERNFAIKKALWEYPLDYPLDELSRLEWPSSYLSYGQYSVVNAEYKLRSNTFVIPYGILGSPFFEVNRPASMNFGSLGMLSAHELSQ